jgi:hypothetical protein
MVGACRHPISGPLFWKWGQQRVTITIYDESFEKNRQAKLVRLYLATLLHEMLHAFFELWGCGSCRDRHENLGLGGHGPAWQDAALALETAAEDKSFLDLVDVDMSREVSWASKMKASGRRFDGETIALAKNWGMDVKSVEYWSRKLKLKVGEAPMARSMLEGRNVTKFEFPRSSIHQRTDVVPGPRYGVTLPSLNGKT